MENFKIEEIEKDGLNITIYAYDSNWPETNIEAIKINQQDYESWMIKEGIAEKKGNLDSQLAEFENCYSNDAPEYGNLIAYLQTPDGKTSMMVDRIAEHNTKCRQYGITELDLTESFYHSNENEVA